MVHLELISAGAAESMVRRLEPDIAGLGVRLHPTFGPVGVIRRTFTESSGCPLLITSEQGMGDLRALGYLDSAEVADLGTVQTAVAVRADDPVPDLSTGESLETALRSASVVYLPDPERSTAGAHVRRVLGELGLLGGGVFREEIHPNGATAMRALAGSQDTVAVGCTQATEILQTEGVVLAGPLPPPYDLSTLYQCALVRRRDPASEREAGRVFDLLTGSATRELRRSLGFR